MKSILYVFYKKEAPPLGLLDQFGDVVRCALRCGSGRSQLPGLGELLDEVTRELRNRTDLSGPGGASPEGKPRVWALRPLPARINHRILSGAPLQAAIPWCRQAAQAI